MRLTLLALLALASSLYAQSLDAQSNAPLRKLDFLLGDWTGVAGEKDTPLGAGQGDFSFKPELKQKIIVRGNNAHYDSGATHDDLMVIYRDPGSAAPQAIYFDAEGHVIRYNLSFPSPNRVVFESDVSQAGPRYRLTYWMDGGTLNGRFEIAAPSSQYKTYMGWTSKRR